MGGMMRCIQERLEHAIKVNLRLVMHPRAHEVRGLHVCDLFGSHLSKVGLGRAAELLRSAVDAAKREILVEDVLPVAVKLAPGDKALDRNLDTSEESVGALHTFHW